ncbi:MAG: ParA family protein [Cyanobacteria bacterium P01_A01_bin.116]
MIITVAGFKGGVGKTTTAVHIGCYLSARASTLLVDGDPNRSATGWANRGGLPLKVVDVMASAKHAPNFEHIVIDTAARPDRDSLKSLVEGCDLLILPTAPEALALDAMMQTVDLLDELGAQSYRVLLTMVPSAPRKTGQQARAALKSLPMFSKAIRRAAAFEKASLTGIPVYDVKGDRNAKPAWNDYQSVCKEMMEVIDTNG